MTITEAIQNIDTIILNSRLTRQEHFALVESVKLVMLRCKLADQYELERDSAKKEENAKFET